MKSEIFVDMRQEILDKLRPHITKLKDTKFRIDVDLEDSLNKKLV